MCCCWDWLCQLLASCCPNAPGLDTGDVVNAEAAARGEFILRIVPLSSRALHVAWGEPSGCYGWYKIRYRRRDRDSHGKWESIKPKFARNTADLTGLKVDTEYEVQIEKKDGPVEEQTYSRSYFGRTKPGTRSDRRYEADRGAAESRPLLFHT